MQLLFALNVAYFFMPYQLPTAKSVSLYSGLIVVIVNFLGCGMGLIPDVRPCFLCGTEKIQWARKRVHQGSDGFN